MEMYAVVGWTEQEPAPYLASGVLLSDRRKAAELAGAHQAVADLFVGENPLLGPYTYAVAKVQIVEDDPHVVPDTEGH